MEDIGSTGEFQEFQVDVWELKLPADDEKVT